MSVVARFYVAEMTKRVGQQREFKMYPVTRGPENKKWAAATPSGEFRIVTGAEGSAAGDWLESMLGKDVAITLEARPLICARCNQEIGDGQYTGTTEHADGTTTHQNEALCESALARI